MKKLLDSIQDEYTRAYVWRAYNTFKSVIIPILLPILYINLQEVESYEVIYQKEFWMMVGYSSLLALMGGAIAGFDKVRRMP